MFAGEVELLLDKLVEKNLLDPAESQEILIQTREEMKKSMVKGDLRTRYQVDLATSSALPDRERMRMRLRIGFNTRIADNLSAGFGFATGAAKTYDVTGSTPVSVTVSDGEPRSTNHTFGDTFSKAQMMVDYGYIQYDPAGWITAYIGKFKNPVWQTTDLLWDGDLNPDGIALPMKFRSNNMDILINCGYFLIDEAHSSTSKEKSRDPSINVIQPVINKPLGTTNLKLGVAYYQTASVKGYKLDYSAKTNTGAGMPVIEYVCLNPSLDIKIPDVMGYTLKVFGDYVTNSATGSPVNQGNCVGIKFGSDKVSSKGDWELKLLQRYLEKDAWLDIFPDSDAYGGATGTKGMELIFSYGITANLSFGMDYYRITKIGSTDEAKDTKSLAQFDLVYKF